MPNFKLDFRLVFDDEICGVSIASDRSYSVIVSAESPKEACKISESLIGQQVFERETLGDLHSVEQAEEGAVPINHEADGYLALY